MKTIFLPLAACITTIMLVGCTTVTDQYGMPHNVMTPMGAAVLQTAVSAGIGAGTGALMKNVNSVGAGAISATAGSIGSQVVNAMIPTTTSYNNGYQQQYRQPQYQQPQYQQPQYQQSYRQNNSSYNNQNYNGQYYQPQYSQPQYSQNNSGYNNQVIYQQTSDGQLVRVN